MSGTALRAPDILGHPACHELHTKIHNDVAAYKERQVRWIMETIAHAVAIGRIVITEDDDSGVPF